MRITEGRQDQSGVCLGFVQLWWTRGCIQCNTSTAKTQYQTFKITPGFERCAHLINLRHMLLFSYPEISRQGREEAKGKEARLGLKNFFAAVEDKFNGESRRTEQCQQYPNLYRWYPGHGEGSCPPEQGLGLPLSPGPWGSQGQLCGHAFLSGEPQGQQRAVNLQNLPFQPYNKSQHARKVGIWLTSSFTKN